jgi:hypothetical protein
VFRYALGIKLGQNVSVQPSQRLQTFNLLFERTDSEESLSISTISMTKFILTISYTAHTMLIVGHIRLLIKTRPAAKEQMSFQELIGQVRTRKMNRITDANLEHHKAEQNNELGPIQLWSGSLFYPSILVRVRHSSFHQSTFYISTTQLAPQIFVVTFMMTRRITNFQRCHPFSIGCQRCGPTLTFISAPTVATSHRKVAATSGCPLRLWMVKKFRLQPPWVVMC